MKNNIHPSSIVQTKKIGSDTRVWQFVVILDGASIGKKCNICSHVYIEGDVKILDSVTIKAGVQLWDGLRVGNNVFIGPNATFTNDVFPRSKNYPSSFANTIIKDNASIGAGAVILPGIIIGENAMVGAGAVVTKDVLPNSLVTGNPAKHIKFIE
jgi:acetyltransferase-like isoleucine patch superfamily enzyme